MNLKSLYEKYKDVIPYLFFGVCTTVVNVVAYWLCAHLIELNTLVSTTIAWILAVLFAYITNRKWVFHSKARTSKEITTEMISFFCCRLATGIADLGCMLVFVDFLGFNDVVIKFIANFAVIVLNYAASKLVIFKRKEDQS